ncbi:MAG: bifunctional phosphoribosylaminoimidazolecarboxamide formyltransferase/IMP cyclohydrolase [Bacteroidales bacterium]|nr:bifunctional phosphoribosylaminoimidazolecarboxamide formyltransferase/IMP cyclohydrolase [Bacteroidales bacterium]
MTDQIKIKSALISVYSKEGVEDLARKLESYGIRIFSTGGTFDFLKSKGINATPIESVTSYPSILGGRVKTLHPKIFGGILWRRDQLADTDDVEKYEIPSIDLVVVDLYPFEKTVGSNAMEDQIIEKIDIGGISLIRAAAKNHAHVMVVPSAGSYQALLDILSKNNGCTNLSDRRRFAAEAFNISSHYDTEIFKYFNRQEQLQIFKQSIQTPYPMRYGENPHQKGTFFGDLEGVFTQLHGKELSYNNLVDVDAAINLIGEFTGHTIAIIKHTNPCGIATRQSFKEAYLDALACDPVSAFGGIIVANGTVQPDTAEELNKLFFEILIADGYENDALNLLKSKKNRIILQKNSFEFPKRQFKSILNGVLEQEKDMISEQNTDFQYVTNKKPSPGESEALFFANKVAKHLKSNTIVLVKNNQLIGCGMGQTSRVDALRQAIVKARVFGFDTAGSVIASDAFFPFADCVEIADEAGITAVIQPGGSIRDIDSVNYCNEHNMSMVFTGIRHFKH